jgi:hypothetical protein
MLYQSLQRLVLFSTPSAVSMNIMIERRKSQRPFSVRAYVVLLNDPYYRRWNDKLSAAKVWRQGLTDEKNIKSEKNSFKKQHSITEREVKNGPSNSNNSNRASYAGG